MSDKTSALQHRQVARDWLAEFSEAVTRKDVQDVTDLFLPNGWLRDSLVFSWDSRSLEGRDRIAEYLRVRLPTSQIAKIRLDDRAGLAPATFSLSQEINGVEAAFVFETPVLRGRGLVRLQLESDSLTADLDSTATSLGKRWKALSVYVATDNIKGHEEVGHESGIYDSHTLSWSEVSAARRADIEANPQVLVIGAGQTGLQVSARLQQMGLRTIVIERNEYVGDNWRKRYPTLSLNTPRTHHCLLYAPFPITWPTYTPRDKVASWLAHYAESQDIVVWTTSYPISSPSYDASSHRWTITINKSSIPVTLRPSHIVLATGTLGDPYTPLIPSASLFHGPRLHASEYRGGASFTSQRVLVVGAGTTAADLCQDLVTRGARSVTMLQRRATTVVSRALADQEFRAWPEGVAVEVGDFKVAATPLGLLSKIAKTPGERQRRKAVDAAMHEGLRKAGLVLEDGVDGGGRRSLVYERLGGYWIDVGAADLIISGKIAVRAGEIAGFSENGSGVTLNDGSTLDADAVIFATGYQNIRPSVAKIFGADVIGRTQEVWGLDAEGELRGCYRPSGVPGLWYAAGDFFHSRYMSKQLALLIKAEELGLTTFTNPASIGAEALGLSRDAALADEDKRRNE
ncbi:FAD/NAD-binding domain-containing protein [Phellopilus nigrolimitatus]|nr:FAD/NAD-binding domain-containing protein [Phellopilus nigrolimitatus]